jgi:hypothetical protein
MSPRPRIWSALVHYPVLDRDGGVVTTSVTNMDVHDLARTSRTYGLERFIVVTPIDIHRDMVERVTSLWQGEKYGRRTPSRQKALETVRTAASIDKAAAMVEEEAGAAPLILGTTARRLSDAASFQRARSLMTADPDRPWLILFGTGWGLAPGALERCDHVLEPVEGAGDYNHLSVRSAAAVILDRLTSI